MNKNIGPGSAARPASCPVGAGGSFPGSESAGA